MLGFCKKHTLLRLQSAAKVDYVIISVLLMFATWSYSRIPLWFPLYFLAADIENIVWGSILYFFTNSPLPTYTTFFDKLIVRKVIPCTLVSILDISTDSDKPFYVVLLLAKLLSGDTMPESKHFTYSYMLHEEMKELLESVEPTILQALNIPDNAPEPIDEASSGQVSAYKRIKWVQDNTNSQQASSKEPLSGTKTML